MKYNLMEGDCLALMREIPDASVDMILCDLPYGTTACKWDSVIPLEPLWEEYWRICKGAVVLTASQPFTSALVCSALSEFKHEWIWEKNRGSNFASLKYAPMKEHESVLVFAKKRVTYNPVYEPRAAGGASRAKYIINPSNTGKRDAYGGIQETQSRSLDPNMRVPRSIQKFNTQVGLHPTQKPVALMEYMIRTYTDENMVVLDNCMGSGTTGVACANTGRRFIGMERDPTYFNIAHDRVGKAYAVGG